MEVRHLTDDWEESYEAFVRSHPEALLYYSAKYKKFLENLLRCEAHYLVTVDGEAIRGVFPIMRKLGKYGYVYNSLPFYGSHGGILANRGEGFSLLMETYSKLVKGETLAASTVISNPLADNGRPLLEYHFTDERISQMTALPFTGNIENQLIESFDPSARRNIRKAEKLGIKVSIENGQFDFLKAVHCENMNAIGGRSKPDSFFTLVSTCFEVEEDYNLYVARLREDPIAALLVFYYNGVVEYFVPATMEAFRSYQPLALIVYKAMVDAGRKGLRLWNWGGTWLTQQGVYRFKKKWSASERSYFYYTYVKNQEIYQCRPEELLAEYEHFFVLPFSLLRRDGHA